MDLYYNILFLFVKEIKKDTSHTDLYKGNYRVADKSLARPTYRCILFDGENISFDASLVIYI